MRTPDPIRSLRLFCLIVLVSGPCLVKAQPMVNVPASFLHPEIFTQEFLTKSISPYTLPALNNRALMSYADSVDAASATGKYMKRYGYGIANNMDLKSAAQYHNPSIANGKLWIFKVSSATALGLQFNFSKFTLPLNASLYIYTANRQQVLGPYTAMHGIDSPVKAISFGSVPIFSNEVYLEYYESDSDKVSGEVVFANIIHLFSDVTPGDAADCQLDVPCVGVNGCKKNAVALMLSYDGNNNLTSLCTGTLMNNTSNNGTPYFLTAAHCVPTSNFLYNMQFVFDYQRAACDGVDPFPLFTKVIYGALSVVSQDNLDVCGTPQRSDYCLLKLNEGLSYATQLGLCYAGWTIEETPEPTDIYTLVHHPKGDFKKGSLATDLALQQINVLSPCSSSYYLDGDNFYNPSMIYGAAPEQGSSGAPLFNGLGQVIATVTGGQPNTPNYQTVDPCNPASYSLYLGRFRKHWSFGNFAGTLDPGGIISATAPAWMCYCPAPPSPSFDCDTKATFEDGIKINGKDGIPVMCPTDLLTLTPLNAECFYLESEKKRVRCSDLDLNSPPDDHCCERSWFKCYCNFVSYQVFISELDYNLGPTTNSWSKIYTRKSGLNLANPAYPSFYVHPSDLGMSFVPGKFYNIGIGTWINNVYQYSSRYIYILPNDLNINTATVGTSIYAMNDITLQNVTVPQVDIEVRASNQIAILQNSGLSGGHYFIRTVNCNSFRIADNPGTPWVAEAPESSPGQPPVNLKEQSALVEEEIKVIPNPTKGNFKVRLPEHFSQSMIEITDVLGRTVYRSSSGGLKERDVDLSGMTNGIYYLRVSNTAGISKVFTILKE
jgi:hypothetical protein